MASLDPATKSSGATPTQVLRVLVVEADEAVRQDFVLRLGQAWPFESEMLVEFAAEGREALERLATARFSLIVIAWQTAESHSGELLRGLRQAGVRTPAVILSDLPRHQILDDIEALGAALLDKVEMNAINLREAIASSLRMLGRPNLADTQSILPKTAPQSASPDSLRPAQ
jgi:DNA-binding NarL/FixJ family response regulator